MGVIDVLCKFTIKTIFVIFGCAMMWLSFEEIKTGSIDMVTIIRLISGAAGMVGSNVL